LTAEIFFHQPLFRDEIIYIAGDTLTYRELADLMQAHWGENIQRKLRTMKSFATTCKTTRMISQRNTDSLLRVLMALHGAKQKHSMHVGE